MAWSKVRVRVGLEVRAPDLGLELGCFSSCACSNSWAPPSCAWMVNRRWNRRLWRRLARAPEAVAGRPVWAGLFLGMLSCPESPGAP